MKFHRTSITRAVAATILGATLIAGAGSAFAQPYGDRGPGAGPRGAQMSEADRAQMRERMLLRAKQRLDRMAARLEIKASQQDTWNAYRQVRETAIEKRAQRPGADADAATLTRFRAEMAQRRAQHMAAVADATSKLQAVLDADQRKVLDEITRNPGPRGNRGGGQGGHRGGGHGGHRHG
jgi:hypothetical protein